MICKPRSVAPGAALLLALSLGGCSHPKADQSAQTQTSPTQSAGSQPAGSAAPDNNTANGAAMDNNASQAPNNAQPPNASAAPGAPAAPNANAGAAQTAPQPLTIPARTTLTVRLQQSLSSASARPGERFEAVIDQPVIVDERIVLPVGTMVMGHVTVARHSGRLRHPGELGLTLDTVSLGQQQIPLATGSVVAHGRSHKKRNWGWMGGGAGGGAAIGALAAGGKGALIGAPIGFAAGTTTAFITGKKDVGFGVERRLSFRLRYDVNVPA